MNELEYIKVYISNGWLDQLIKEIDKNSAFAVCCINDADTPEKDKHIFESLVKRNERIKTKLLEDTDSMDYAKLYKSEYQDVFWILLENTVKSDTEKEEAHDEH